MAQASGVTLILELNRLPILFGAKQLARQGNKTRASATNRAFAEAFTRIEEPADSLTLEVAFDAQTSGGLLVSVAADKAEELVATARAAGAEATCIVGRVIEKQDVSLILRD